MKSKLFLIFTVVVFFTFSDGNCQKRRTSYFTGIGFELDVLPYFTGGYYGSIWYGHGPVRGRFIVANTNVPSFFIPTGFKDYNLQVYALIGDYFIQSSSFEKLWVGLGVEYWDGTIVSESTEISADHNNYVITIRLGYVWKFYKNFYLNPWFGLHIIAAGDTSVPVGNEEFKPPVITPEISLKLGWHFTIQNRKRSYLRSR